MAPHSVTSIGGKKSISQSLYRGEGKHFCAPLRNSHRRPVLNEDNHSNHWMRIIWVLKTYHHAYVLTFQMRTWTLHYRRTIKKLIRYFLTRLFWPLKDSEHVVLCENSWNTRHDSWMQWKNILNKGANESWFNGAKHFISFCVVFSMLFKVIIIDFKKCSSNSSDLRGICATARRDRHS